MISRINLHPGRKPKAKSNPAQGVLVVSIGIALVVVVAAFLMASECSSKTDELTQELNRVNADISDINSRIKDVSTMGKKIEEIRSRINVLSNLVVFRRGPQFVLNEFGRLLSNPRDVLTRKEASESGWLLAWEPDNIMLKSFKELGEGLIQIDGTARKMDDVYEFWTRMKTSKLLREVELVEIKGGRDSGSSEATQTFSFRMKANFYYQTKEGAALKQSLESDSESGSLWGEKPDEGAARTAKAK